MQHEATRILAIRHGETAWNVAARLQGHLDLPLNEAGHAQARRLARALAERGETIDAVFTSDLQRAADTARPVAEAMDAPLALTAGLRERCFGDFQGFSFEQVAHAWPEEAARWRRREPAWSPPGAGAESLLQFQERISHTLQALAAQNVGKNIAIFTHGGVLDVVYRLATGLGLQAPRTWKIGNAAVNRLLWTPDSGLALVGCADTTDLEDESLDESVT